MGSKNSYVLGTCHVSTEPVAEVKKKKKLRRNFEERVNELVDNLGGFFAYNPGYVQEGPVQIAVSAKLDEGTYQYSPTDYAENILVSKNPRKGADFYVSDLGGFKKVSGSVGKRCLFSRTYYIWQELGNYHSHLLLGNGEQFKAAKIDKAFEWLVRRNGGTALKEGAFWFRFELEDRFCSIGRILCYWDKEEDLRVLICIPNSGTILDYPAHEIAVGEALESGKYYTTRFLSFILMENGDINPNRTISQRVMNDAMLK